MGLVTESSQTTGILRKQQGSVVAWGPVPLKTTEWKELARPRVLGSSWTRSFDTPSEITKKNHEEEQEVKTNEGFQRGRVGPGILEISQSERCSRTSGSSAARGRDLLTHLVKSRKNHGFLSGGWVRALCIF